MLLYINNFLLATLLSVAFNNILECFLAGRKTLGTFGRVELGSWESTRANGKQRMPRSSSSKICIHPAADL